MNYRALPIITLLFHFIGMLFSYVLLQISVWWLIHVITLLWKVLFPFHVQSFSAAGKLKRIYITSAIVGILFPVVPIVVSVSKFAAEAVEEAENGTSAIELFVSGGLGFSLSRFPPLLCTATDESVLFYSVVLPVDQVLAIGCSMLVIIFWSIHKVSKVFTLQYIILQLNDFKKNE